MYQHRHVLAQGKQIPAVLLDCFLHGRASLSIFQQTSVIWCCKLMQAYSCIVVVNMLGTPLVGYSPDVELRILSLFYEAFGLARNPNVGKIINGGE